jgi:uncharacterized repeat protein (TIGR02543 family)
MKVKANRLISAMLALTMLLPPSNCAFANEQTEPDAVSDVAVSDSALDVGESNLSAYSLMPIQEVDATVSLEDLLPVELKNVKVSTILSRMLTSDGEHIAFDENTVTVWEKAIETDEYGDNIWSDEKWKKLKASDTINLYEDEYSYSKQLQIIVGSGNQTDLDNVRYNVKIKSPSYRYLREFELYEQYEKVASDGTTQIVRNLIDNRYAVEDFVDDENDNYKNILDVSFSLLPKYNKDDDYYLGFLWGDNATTAGVEIEVYDGAYDNAETAIEAAKADPTKNLTSQIIGNHMNEADAGCKAKWATYEDGRELTFVYSRYGEIVGCETIVVDVSSSKFSANFGFSLYEQVEKSATDGNKETVRQEIKNHLLTYNDRLYDEDDNYIGSKRHIEIQVDGKYGKTSDYYLGLTLGQTNSEQLEYADINMSVYDGEYETAEAAKAAASLDASLDLTNQLIGTNMTQLNAGCKAKWADYEEDTGRALTAIYERNGEVIGIESFYVSVVPGTHYFYNSYQFGLYEQVKETADDGTENVVRKSIQKYVRIDDGNDDDDYYDDDYDDDTDDGTDESGKIYAYLWIGSIYDASSDFYLDMSLGSDYKDVNLKVYDGLYASAEAAMAAAALDKTKDLTSSITNVSQTQLDAGCKAKWASYKDGRELTVVYERYGTVLGFDNLVLSVKTHSHYVVPRLRAGDGSSVYSDVKYEYSYLNNDESKPIEKCTYNLYAGKSAEAEYTFYMDYCGNSNYDKNGDWDPIWDNSQVTKAVEGHYATLEAAAQQPDIKDKLFKQKNDEGNYIFADGEYQAKFNGNGVDFTVFVGDETYYVTIVVQETNKGDDYDASFDRYFDIPEEPLKSADRYFTVKGLSNGDTELDTYVVPYTQDSYYVNGYQTIFVNDVDADMSKIKPYVDISKSASLYHDGVLEQTDKDTREQYISEQDFARSTTEPNRTPNNSVKYTVSAENHVNHRNYWITAVKKVNGPKLFVNGPDEREVFFDDYFGEVHDIFVANIGTEKLTGINVTLTDAKNVKLDDYWTIGGEGNDTLMPFETTQKGSNKSELFNVAKVRLVPDGEGEISGKLTITADGQTPRVITLKGNAGNPEIDTTELPDAVKYVPYSTIVTTNNIHDWIEPTFRLVHGELPEGVELLPSGEIYGVPKESGEFNIYVSASYSTTYNVKPFQNSYAELTLVVKDNTDENVDASVDEGYEISVRVPDFKDYQDRVFKVEGALSEFIDFWLDGDKLEKDVDYTLSEGSTVVTIKAQTFEKAGDGKHTIANEYRVAGDRNNNLKKAAQNYTRDDSVSNNNDSTNGDNSSGSGSGSSSRSGGGGGGGSSSGTYKVTYDSNGGSAVATQSVKRGQKITFFATPVKAGYVFVDWYTDKELTKPYNRDTAVKSAFTLYAKWEKANLKVWFDSNGGASVNSIDILGDTALTGLPTTQKDGYEFAGWFTQDGKQFNEGDKVYANTTLYAQWKLIIPDEAPEDASGFVDVDKAAWYYNDVDWAYGNGYMVGYNNAIFAPKNNVTMSNLVTVLAKLSGDDLTGFADDSAWYAPYAKWAVNAGIIDEFNPNESISREDMAVVLVKFMNYTNREYSVDDTAVVFADDAEISAEAREAVVTLYKLGVISGKGNNVIDPNGATTRAEFASLIHRLEA